VALLIPALKPGTLAVACAPVQTSWLVGTRDASCSALVIVQAW
jgi:hypothetical protein